MENKDQGKPGAIVSIGPYPKSEVCGIYVTIGKNWYKMLGSERQDDKIVVLLEPVKKPRRRKAR